MSRYGLVAVGLWSLVACADRSSATGDGGGGESGDSSGQSSNTGGNGTYTHDGQSSDNGDGATTEADGCDPLPTANLVWQTSFPLTVDCWDGPADCTLVEPRISVTVDDHTIAAVAAAVKGDGTHDGLWVRWYLDGEDTGYAPYFPSYHFLGYDGSSPRSTTSYPARRCNYYDGATAGAYVGVNLKDDAGARRFATVSFTSGLIPVVAIWSDPGYEMAHLSLDGPVKQVAGWRDSPEGVFFARFVTEQPGWEWPGEALAGAGIGIHQDSPDSIRAVRTDGDGTTVVSAHSVADGALVWETPVEGALRAQQSVGDEGAVVVAAAEDVDGETQLTVVRVDEGGDDVAWRWQGLPTDSAPDRVPVDVDDAGYAYAGWRLPTENGHCVAVVKITQDGELDGLHVVAGDTLHDLAVSPSGDVYVAVSDWFGQIEM